MTTQNSDLAARLQTYRDFHQKLGYKPTVAQHRACLFLIRQGWTFVKDFGIENAITNAKFLRYLQKKKAVRQRASVPPRMTKKNTKDARQREPGVRGATGSPRKPQRKGAAR